MLTEHPKIQPALVRCHAERMIRVQDIALDGAPAGVMNDSRFQSVVDDRGTEIGTVSDRFRLVQTADVVAAFDLAADKLGYAFEPKAAYYRNGLAKIELDIPARTIKTGDRDGGLTPRITMLHGLGGRGGLRVYAGGEIHVCSNGLVSGTILDYSYARHTRALNVQAIVNRAVGALDAGIQRTEVLIEAAKRQWVPGDSKLVEDLLDSIGARRRTEFAHIIAANERAYGGTAWGLIQATTEMATHNMRERRDGSHVWAADDWSRTQVDRIARALDLVPAR